MTQANNHPDSSLSFQEKLGVFISYPREGAIITNAIQNALVDLDRTRIDVFVDTVAIPMGEEIGPYIMTALDKAHWFIGVDTETLREAFSWCGLELGVYTENKRKSDSLAQSKILCIYDGTPPDLFKNRQQVQVVSLEAKHQQDLTERIYSVDEAPLNALFVQFADYYHDFYSYCVTN
jgi:hypothetical protein